MQGLTGKSFIMSLMSDMVESTSEEILGKGPSNLAFGGRYGVGGIVACFGVPDALCNLSRFACE